MAAPMRSLNEATVPHAMAARINNIAPQDVPVWISLIENWWDRLGDAVQKGDPVSAGFIKKLGNYNPSLCMQPEGYVSNEHTHFESMATELIARLAKEHSSPVQKNRFHL